MCMSLIRFTSSPFPLLSLRLLFIFIAIHLISLLAKESDSYRIHSCIYHVYEIHMYTWWIINLIGFHAASSYLLSSWRDVCKWSVKSIKDCQPIFSVPPFPGECWILMMIPWFIAWNQFECEMWPIFCAECLIYGFIKLQGVVYTDVLGIERNH